MSEFNNKYGINFLGKHSYRDFGLRVSSKSLEFPEKDKVTIPLPYSNRVIDLSAVYGNENFKEREFKIQFFVSAFETETKEQLYQKWTNVVNWLEGSKGKQPLFDDVMPHYYYLGEVVTAPSWEEFRLFGKLTIVWDCYPFRLHDSFEGNDIWDDFNFESDVAQITKYEVNVSKDIELINIGTNDALPTIVADANFILVTDTRTINISAGTTNPDLVAYPFVLPVGESKIHIKGTGTIEFKWRKELI